MPFGLTFGKLAQVALGAYGAKKSAKAMKGANDLDLKKLRREAEENGFNPLTVLRATGGQGSTKGPSGGLASGAFFSTFAQGIPSILESNYDKKMKDAQLASTIANTRYTGALTHDLLTNPNKGGRRIDPLSGLEIKDAFIQVKGDDGKLTKVPNNEITEGNNPIELATAAGMQITSEVANKLGVPLPTPTSYVDMGSKVWNKIGLLSKGAFDKLKSKATKSYQENHGALASDTIITSKIDDFDYLDAYFGK